MRINYLAPTEQASGYGRVADALRQHLVAAGVALTRIPSPRALTLVVGDPKRGATETAYGARRWLLTMIEGTRMSEDWVARINSTYERVLVPSPCQVGYVRGSGVSVPVHYLPLGCDHEPPYPATEPRATGPLTILTYSYGDNRKGAELAATAVRAALKGRDDVQLVIKVRNATPALWLTALEEDGVNLVLGRITTAHWHHLLHTADMFVFPSRAEGYGLPPREAALAGVPTIATQWLGMWDADRWAWAVPPARLVQAYYEKPVNNAPDARWAAPDETLLRLRLRQIADDLGSARQQAQTHREYLLAHASWTGTAHALTQLLEQFA